MLAKDRRTLNWVMYNTHPHLVVEEDIAVTDDKLSIAMDEEDLMSTPPYKINLMLSAFKMV